MDEVHANPDHARMRSRPVVLALVALLGAGLVFAWLTSRAADAPDAGSSAERRGSSAPADPASGRASQQPDARGEATRELAAGPNALPTLRGRVVDVRGKVVPGAAVHAFARAATDPLSLHAQRQRGLRSPALGSTATDADGRFAVALPHEALDLPLEVHVVADAHADAMRVVPAFEPDHDLGDCELGDGRTLRGTVRDALTEAPLADAEVAVLLPRQRGLALPGRENGRTARTDGNGEYAIAHVPVGHCSVRASAPRHAQQEWPQQAIQRDEEPVLDFALQPGRTVRGSVVDRSGNAIADAFVRAVPQSQPDLGVVGGRTGADGSFALDGVALGAVAVHASAAGWQTARTEVADGETGPVRIELDPQGHLRVRLAAIAGTPLADVRLRARGTGAARVRRTDTLRFDVPPTDGVFELRGLDPGEWIVEARAAGTASTTSAPVLVEAGRATEVQLALSRGGEVAGRVLGPGGRPVARARVRLAAASSPGGELGALVEPLLAPLGRAPEAFADGDGAFAVRGVAVGEVALLVHAPGLAPHRSGPHVVVEGGALRVPDVHLANGSTLAGKALHEGRVDARIVVRLRAVTTGDVEETRVGRDGAFAFAHLPAGRYEVGAGRRDAEDPFLEDSDRARSATTVEVDGERDVAVELEVRPR